MLLAGGMHFSVGIDNLVVHGENEALDSTVVRVSGVLHQRQHSEQTLGDGVGEGDGGGPT